MRTDRLKLASLALAASIAATSGCSLFQERLAPSLKAEVTEGGPRAAPDVTYSVEIHPNDGKPKSLELPLTEQLHAQEALEKAGADKKFRRMHVRLIRMLPSGGWHKMELEYDRTNRRLAPEFDYAVLPGDRLIVIEDTSNAFTDILDALKPFGLGGTLTKSKPDSKYELRG